MSETENRPQGDVRAEEAEMAARTARTTEKQEPQERVQQAGEQPTGPAENQAEGAAPAENPELEAANAEIERLKLELDAARRRVDELARAYQALNADREEFKQRLSRERERMIDVEKGKVAGALLEAIDDLDRSLAATPHDESPLAQGVRMIREALLKRAIAEGIERLEVVGKPFDPNLAEAVDMEITAEAEADQTVVAEIRAGYRLKDRVIRAARVKVAKYIPPAQA